MRIVEPDQPVSGFIVQRQRILQPMRPLRRDGDLLHLELDPMLTGRIDDEGFAIEIEKCVERRIAPRSLHVVMTL